MSKRGMIKNTPEDIEQKWVDLFAGLAASRVIERPTDVVDGSVWYSLCEGRIESICETARIATNAGIVPPLEELGD
jgi:hypothetical protein